jgi:hypothetical protein
MWRTVVHRQITIMIMMTIKMIMRGQWRRRIQLFRVMIALGHPRIVVLKLMLGRRKRKKAW